MHKNGTTSFHIPWFPFKYLNFLEKSFPFFAPTVASLGTGFLYLGVFQNFLTHYHLGRTKYSSRPIPPNHSFVIIHLLRVQQKKKHHSTMYGTGYPSFTRPFPLEILLISKAIKSKIHNCTGKIITNFGARKLTLTIKHL